MVPSLSSLVEQHFFLRPASFAPPPGQSASAIFTLSCWLSLAWLSRRRLSSNPFAGARALRDHSSGLKKKRQTGLAVACLSLLLLFIINYSFSLLVSPARSWSLRGRNLIHDTQTNHSTSFFIYISPAIIYDSLRDQPTYNLIPLPRAKEPCSFVRPLVRPATCKFNHFFTCCLMERCLFLSSRGAFVAKRLVAVERSRREPSAAGCVILGAQPARGALYGPSVRQSTASERVFHPALPLLPVSTVDTEPLSRLSLESIQAVVPGPLERTPAWDT